MTKLGVDFNRTDVKRTVNYIDLITEYSGSINLVGNANFNNLATRHLFDSLAAFKFLTGHNIKEVIDVGSGAGFPGLPLAIFVGSLNFTLVESNIKKSDFLKTVIDLIGIKNATILNDRAENLGRLAEYREKFDVAMARALAKTPTSLELLSSLAKVNGYVMLFKSRRVLEDVIQYSVAAYKLGLQQDTVMDVDVPELQEKRALLIYRKITPIAHKYPRKPGIPKKRPIT